MFGLFKREKVSTRWKIYATVTYVTMLIVNGLAGSTTLLGGVDTAAISDKYANLFAPAGFTFAIWGVIYLLLGGFVLRMWGVWRTKKPRLADDAIVRVVKLFILSCLLNVLWLLAWQYEVLWLSVAIMLALLATLLMIHREVTTPERLSLGETVAVKAPFGVYAGWITVATIANISTWLVSLQWDGFGLSHGTWMVAVLIVGAVITMTTMIRRNDWFYGAVAVWAYAGILAKHLSESGWNGHWPSVLAALYVLLPILIILTLQTARRRR